MLHFGYYPSCFPRKYVPRAEYRVPNGSFQKRSTLPPQRKFLPSGGGGEKKLLLIIVNVLGHPRGVNFQFPLWGWYGCFLE